MKLKPRKCEMFKKKVRFPGRIFFESTLTPVLQLKDRMPESVGDFWKLVGLTSYYRHYIQNLSRIVKPIYDLLKAEEQTKQIGIVETR